MTADMLSPASSPPEALYRAQETVLPAMRDAVARLDRTNQEIAAYHLGWTDPDGAPVAGGGGKAVRPALALLSARAACAPAAVGIPGAVAVELVHNFSLVHDDVMDGDTQRRHRPTVWAVWGTPVAILVGDALLALAQEVLLDSPSPHRDDAARLLARTTRELIGGQARDLEFEQRDDVELPECLDMAAGKTGALLSASASIGAVLAGAGTDVVEALSAYGAHLGVAFQLVDDLMGIWGAPARTGKPVLSDLRSRKKTLPVTYAVTHGGASGVELADWLAATGDDDEISLRRIARLVEAGGGRQWALEEAHRRLAAADRAVHEVPIPAPARDELAALARFVVGREA